MFMCHHINHWSAVIDVVASKRRIQIISYGKGELHLSDLKARQIALKCSTIQMFSEKSLFVYPIILFNSYMSHPKDSQVKNADDKKSNKPNI